MAPYSMAGLLSRVSERVFAMWSGSYHVTDETSRFILSTSSAKTSPEMDYSTGNQLRPAGINFSDATLPTPAQIAP